MSRCLWLMLLLELGCGAPTQRDALIRVDHEGFAARMYMLCRLGVTDEVAEQTCGEQKARAERRKRPGSRERARAAPRE
jgi:hypothetical protein